MKQAISKKSDETTERFATLCLYFRLVRITNIVEFKTKGRKKKLEKTMSIMTKLTSVMDGYSHIMIDVSLP